MTWYIYRGEDLQREQTLKFPFYRTLDENYDSNDLVFNDELLQSEDRVAPRYPNVPSVKRNCLLKANLSSVPKSEFKRDLGKDGKVYYHIHYDLVVTIKPAVMKFSLEMKGKEMGSVDAKFD